MPEDDDVVPMVICPQCEHLVPETNLTVHEARCQGRKRPARDTATTTTARSNEDDSEGSDREHQRNTRQNLGNSNDYTKEQPSLPRARWEAPPRARHPQQPAENDLYNEHALVDDDGDSHMSDEDEVQFVSPVAAPAATASQQQEVIDLVGAESDGGGHWTCPQCTLENPVSSSTCEACLFRRHGSERPPDQVRRERLVGGPQQGGSSGLIGGAALLGSVLGGTGAYLRGQPLSSGVWNGAMTGAVSGAVLNQLASPPTVQQQSQSQSQTFVSAGSGPTMQSLSIVRTPDGRVVATQHGNGTASTASYGGGGAGAAAAGMPPAANPNQELNTLLQQLLMQQLMRGQGGGAQGQHRNTDQMSYEQLLQTFGSGTENLGAGEQQIRSLPSATIQDADKLPADSQQCSICLDDFKTGDERKILPCLHGFHADCVDKWLRSNGNCPICKHRLGR